ncbi:MAG: serine/threonine protein kinase [bacterium]|nr:serine/threonine protein kinase [bacterium]
MKDIGQYKILELLGRGGMGAVYRGQDSILRRQVAVKIILPDPESGVVSQSSVDLFLREARAAAALDHANIVRIHNIGFDEQSSPYIVMEYVDGSSLDKLIDANVPDTKTLQRRLGLFSQILEAMAYAHEQGVVHRDLKPGNVMVSKSGQVKIMDFGLALINNQHTRTRTGQFMGTLAYAAPEQIVNSKNTDERTDIYSLGVILFELLTGQRPFTGNLTEVVGKVLTIPAPSVREFNSGVSTALSDVVARCLEKDPDDRFQSVREILASFGGQDGGRSYRPITSSGGTYGRTRITNGLTVVSSFANKRVGDRFEFGRYPQGANGEVEPITWRVLQRNSDSLLVIAEYGLVVKPYNEMGGDITWADCTLRRWLNGEFLNKAFNRQEQSLIKTSHLSNNAGPSTDDRVFLLSIDEATGLFANDKDREAKPTAYVTDNSGFKYDGMCSWWLRSRMYTGGVAAIVSSRGNFGCDPVSCLLGVSVRPAFLLAI